MIKVAIVGRPNVGKSTLFNRLSTKKKAIVHDEPGVTRDWNITDAHLFDIDFKIIDTPGLEKMSEDGSLLSEMTKKAKAGISSADIVFFLYDARVGVHPLDETFAKVIRQLNKKVYLIANKSESNVPIDYSSLKLGFGNPVPISSEHKIGFDLLYEILLKETNLAEEVNKVTKENQDTEDDVIKIAIVGRPNAGKSTFINAALKEDRVLTGKMPGVTRDTVEIPYKYKNKDLIIIDSAGIRKKNTIEEEIEEMSVGRSIEAIMFSHVVVLMLDATMPLEMQDLKIANIAEKEGRGVVIVVNKWDLINNKEEYQKVFTSYVKHHLAQMSEVEVVYISSIDKTNIEEVFESAIKVYESWNIKVPTSTLNDWVSYVTSKHKPPFIKNNKRLKVKFIKQLHTRPALFKIFVNYKDDVPTMYHKYLVKELQTCFKLHSVPLRVIYAASQNPYDSK
jgi:GTP-binding protein